MPRLVLPAAALLTALTVLATAGCAEGDYGCGPSDRPDPTGLAGRLPVEVEPLKTMPGPQPEEIEALLPPEGSEQTVTDRVEREVLRQTVTMAGAIGELSPVTCGESEYDSDGRETIPCTVRYEGLVVPWEVRVSHRDGMVWYKPWPLSSVLTAEGVYAAYGWLRRDEPRGEVWCDRVPTLFRAQVGADTGYRCQMLTYSCHNGDYDLAWHEDEIWVDDEGRLSVNEPD